MTLENFTTPDPSGGVDVPYQFVPYSIFLLISALATLALAVYGIRQRQSLGTNILGLCMTIGTLWSCANALELSATTLEHKLFWANLQYAAYSLGPLAWFLTSCQFTGRSHWLRRKSLSVLFVIPALTILLVWTDPWWGLVRTGLRLDTTGLFSVLAKEYGPWFWIHFVHSYALNFLSMLLLGLALAKKSSIHRRQAFFLLAGICLVVCTNLLYVLGLSPVTRYDLTPVVFSLASALMFWGIYSCELFRLVPIAWETAIEALETAVVVVNNTGRVVDVNPAFCRMFSQEPANALGAALRDMAPDLALLCSATPPEAGRHREMHRSVLEEDRFFEITVSEIKDKHLVTQGRVIAINDITELRLAQERLYLEQREVAVAAERMRFTQDLHDNLGQMLGFCSLQVQATMRELQRDNEEQAHVFLSRLGTVLGEAQSEMRSYVHGMRTREYELNSLADLLRREVSRLQEHEPYQVELEITAYDFPVEEKIQLCSIVKEALSNVRRHAQANLVKVSLLLAQGNWVLSVVDDGVGFAHTSTITSSQGGSGLSFMAERARLLSGDLQVSSEPGQTAVRVVFPYKGAENHADHDR